MGWVWARAWAIIAVCAAAAGAAPGARAQEMVAVRPGVMCTSAAALGKLTLPGGDSRTHAAHPAPADLATARDGGCIDIPPGARVTVQQGFNNTSIVLYAPNGVGPMVVPNIDFAAANGGGGAAPADVGAPAGYRVQQRMATGRAGSPVLEVLEDRRITPAMRARMWGHDTVPIDERDERLPAFVRQPALRAVLRLVSSGGEEMERVTLDYSIAALKPAPLHGLPYPAFLLEEDSSIGMGGGNGPFDLVLSPGETGVRPVRAVPERGGEATTMAFSNHLRSFWAVIPGQGGAADVIHEAFCEHVGDNGQPRAEYRTYRFRDGQWRFASRVVRECPEYESPPPRSAFP